MVRSTFSVVGFGRCSSQTTHHSAAISTIITGTPHPPALPFSTTITAPPRLSSTRIRRHHAPACYYHSVAGGSGDDYARVGDGRVDDAGDDDRPDDARRYTGDDDRLDHDDDDDDARRFGNLDPISLGLADGANHNHQRSS